MDQLKKRIDEDLQKYGTFDCWTQWAKVPDDIEQQNVLVNSYNALENVKAYMSWDDNGSRISVRNLSIVREDGMRVADYNYINRKV